MAHRIEVGSRIDDARAARRKERLRKAGFAIDEVAIEDVYTLEGILSGKQPEIATSALVNPVSHKASFDFPLSIERPFTFAVEIGRLPGVKDNEGNTAHETFEDTPSLHVSEENGVYTSQVTYLTGNLTREDAQKIGTQLANPLIQSIHVKSREEFVRDQGMGTIVPRVKLGPAPRTDIVDILGADQEELTNIGKKGIRNADGTRRGPLALDEFSMSIVKNYFRKLGRNPTDIELESIAQTWSEHCKHTIFANPLDEITEGLYKARIKAATNAIRRAKGKNDFCVSVFTDNAGAIAFDDKWLITDKAETHNTPSLLDPFGGAITGIVGVNRDAIGFGLGAKPIANGFFFCLADPRFDMPLYKDVNRIQKILSRRAIMDGIIEGVNSGGNESGIPTPQGGLFFDERNAGKPLVFVRTVGLIPRESAGRPSHEKEARPGDYIVMVGGRVGKDGEHGATFSSEALDHNSPATAVQIGDPITQKKLSDAIVKEARDLGLYTSITDNGAGGLSCSVAEMAKESGGCYVHLDKVPLKYHGLAPWEIWISESQERMTLSVPQEKWEAFSDLMRRRGVEATVIGEFTDSDKCTVEYEGETIMDLDMDFLHDGLPKRQMTSTYTKPKHEEPAFDAPTNLSSSLEQILARPNITSFAFISQQYDHEVQGTSVQKPLQGRGRVNANATAIKPVATSNKAVILSQGINPTYSDIDTYAMAAAAIDTAVRNAVAAGADIERIAIMDNFCWCSSTEPERLGQLKAAADACYDVATAYGTPFISGKDSMFNDFKGYDSDGNPIKISVPPTLLVSSIGITDDATKTVSLDAKMVGDLVYVIGETHDELGGSEYFAMKGEELRGERYIGNAVPQVNAEKNMNAYRALAQAIQEDLIASAQSVNGGGLAVALAKTAIGGGFGIEARLENLPGTASRDDYALYSESQGRVLVTVAPQMKARFEQVMKEKDVAHANIGVVKSNSGFTIKGKQGELIINDSIDTLSAAYKSTFEGY